jgi:CelD/BcsL family acetyltransferase involved in cellulose biosynthesis
MLTATRLTEAQFPAMRAEWNHLLCRAAAAGPMLSWEWMFSWWETFRAAGARRELRLLACRDENGALCGIAPLLLRSARSSGVTLRRMEFLGTGEEEADETCSEYLDLLATAGAEGEVARTVAGHLAGAGDWDELLLRDVRMDRPGPARLLVEELARNGSCAITVGAQGRCPWIPLPADWNTYLAGLSANSRQLVRRKRRKLDAATGVTFDTVTDAAQITALMPAFRALHQERWTAEGRAGCFASERFTDFIDRLTPRLAVIGGLELAVLRIGGEPAAIYYLLRSGRALYYYNSGVALSRAGEYSPGSVCMGLIIEHAIGRGLGEFHFLKGGGASYKYHWTKEVIPVSTLRARRRGWKSAVAGLGDRATGWLRGVARLNRAMREERQP